MKKQKGFTLFDLIFAVVVVGSGIVGCYVIYLIIMALKTYIGI